MMTVAVAACVLALGHTSTAVALAPKPETPAAPPAHSAAGGAIETDSGAYDAMVAISEPVGTPPGQEKSVPPGQEKSVPPGQEKSVPPGQEKSVPPGQEKSVPPEQESAGGGGQADIPSTVAPTTIGAPADVDSGASTKTSGTGSKSSETGVGIVTVSPASTTTTTTTRETSTPVVSGGAVALRGASTTSTTDAEEPTEGRVSDVATISRLENGDQSFLAGGFAPSSAVGTSVHAASAIEAPVDTTSVVLSWLIEREGIGSSMVMTTPFVVLWTIWDALSSAGSGLAAPASGLATFVGLILFDRGRLAAPNGLVRKREAAA